MLELLFQSPFAFVVVFGGLMLAIGLHEAAHCYMADYLGDPTPEALGRKTLNPLAHLDPFGTLMILFTNFGWGKPAPFDPYNLKNPDRDVRLIALAGPISNLLIAIILSLVLRIFNLEFLGSIFYFLISINVNLALFNLLPIAPLDGSKIFLKDYRLTPNYYLLIIVLLPLFGGHSIASAIISPVSQFLLSFLLP